MTMLIIINNQSNSIMTNISQILSKYCKSHNHPMILLTLYIDYLLLLTLYIDYLLLLTL